MLEVTVIVVGALVGWGLVSLLFRALPQKSQHLARLETLSIKAAAEKWPEILEIGTGSSPEAIEEAYSKLIDEVLKSYPNVLTEPERAEQQRLREILAAAREAGISSAANR